MQKAYLIAIYDMQTESFTRVEIVPTPPWEICKTESETAVLILEMESRSKSSNISENYMDAYVELYEACKRFAEMGRKDFAMWFSMLEECRTIA
jgi:hypothetical protein